MNYELIQLSLNSCGCRKILKMVVKKTYFEPFFKTPRLVKYLNYIHLCLSVFVSYNHKNIV